MRRILFTFFLIALAVFGYSQVFVGPDGDLVPVGPHPAMKIENIQGGFHISDDTVNIPDYIKLNSAVYQTGDEKLYRFDAGSWVEITTGGGIDYDALFAGRTITRDDWDALAGTTYVTLEEVFFPAEPPTATLLVDVFGSNNGNNRTVEFTTAGTQPATANWTAGRQATTGLLTDIDVEGNTQSFIQPNQGSTVNGAQALTITNNTNITIDLTVTSESGNASDALSITWRYKRYWGLDSDGTLTDGELIAGSSEFSTNNNKTFAVSPSSERIYFAYPQSFGNLTSIKLNDLESIGAFTLTTQSHTNESGGVATYNVYVSNNLLTGSITVITD